MILTREVYTHVAQEFIEKSRKQRLIFAITIAIDVFLGILALFFSIMILPALIASIINGIYCVVIARKYNLIKVITKKYEIDNKIQERLQLDSKIFSKSSVLFSCLDIVAGGFLLVWFGLNIGITVISLASGTALIAIIGTKLIQLRKMQNITRVPGVIGTIYFVGRNKNFMKGNGIIMVKIKAALKYVFKTNPITIFCALGALAILIVEGATQGQITETLLSWIKDPTAVDVTFYGLIGGIGTIGAWFGGAETNKQADERKALKTKKEKLNNTEKQAKKIALEKIKQEKAAQEKFRQEQEDQRLNQIYEQVKVELQNKPQ